MLFTLNSYRQLLETIERHNYAIYSIEQILVAKKEGILPEGRYIALRHDVDYFLERALSVAIIEAERRIVTTYYIRKRFFESNLDLIRRIASLGHQIGYHYEEVDTHQKAPHLQVGRDALGFFIGALLDIDRLGFPIRSVCAHGNPLSDIDNRRVIHLLRDANLLDRLAFTYDRELIRTKISERLVGDASLDITGKDFDLYIPDTGRFNPKYNLKDRIDNCPIAGLSGLDEFENILASGQFPRIYMNLHPDRWSGDKVNWLLDLFMDTSKNIVKRILGKTNYRDRLVGEKAKKHHRSVLRAMGESSNEKQGSDS